MRREFPSGWFRFGRRPLRSGILAILVAGALSACTAPNGTSEFNDPYEARNRQAHKFNLKLDRVILRPSSEAYGKIIPRPLRNGVGNFARNLQVPGDILNDLLQARIEQGGENLFRFIVNTTVGVGGLIDVATAIGIPGKPTDFGETLKVWGVREGAYLVVPVIGPSTERGLVGTVVDMAINPVRLVLTGPESNIAIASTIASKFGDRYQFSNTVDSILYESADSYAQTRLLYLQNRRFALGQEAADTYYDPYEDPYGN